MEAPEQSPQGVPQWITSALHLTTVRDPIALQTITLDRIMPRLMPAILALSRRGRYFSFHPFLLLENEGRKLTESNRSLSAFIKAREYEYALAVQHCPRCRFFPSGVVGKQRAGPAVSHGGDELARGESVRSELGGYGLYYRTPLVDLGLVAPAGSPFGEEEITPVDVLNPGLGRDLARAFRAAIVGTDYYEHYMYGDGPIPQKVLVEPFVFTGKSKSDLGWAFVGLIDGGRIKEYADDGEELTRVYRRQMAACTYEVLPGPGRLLRWGVPAIRGHDDLLISAALTARLDQIDWRQRMARGTASQG